MLNSLIIERRCILEFTWVLILIFLFYSAIISSYFKRPTLRNANTPFPASGNHASSTNTRTLTLDANNPTSQQSKTPPLPKPTVASPSAVPFTLILPLLTSFACSFFNLSTCNIKRNNHFDRFAWPSSHLSWDPTTNLSEERFQLRALKNPCATHQVSP
jgi:hypothetical protein